MILQKKICPGKKADQEFVIMKNEVDMEVSHLSINYFLSIFTSNAETKSIFGINSRATTHVITHLNDVIS